MSSREARAGTSLRTSLQVQRSPDAGTQPAPPQQGSQQGGPQGQGTQGQGPQGQGTQGQGPQPASTQAAVDPQQAIRAAAAALVDVGGTADEADRQAVISELIKIPLPGLRSLALAHKRVVVCRNSVTEIRTDLRGVRPRGYPEGRGWDNVPGLNDPASNRVIIATRNGRVPPRGDGHDSANLVLHEVGHAIDDAAGGGSNTAEFQRARTADEAHLAAYFRQAGAAGLRETYAESLARFYNNDPTDAATYPNLHAYWASDPLSRAMQGR